MREEDIKRLIQERKDIVRKQKSIKLLKNYKKVVDRKENYEELKAFIDDLTKYSIVECYIGYRIYSPEDIARFLNDNIEYINKRTKAVLLRIRDPMCIVFYKSLIKKKILPKIINIAVRMYKQSRFESLNVIEQWIDDANKEIRNCLRLYKTDLKGSFNKLQLAVEKLLKAYALYLGLSTEDKLRNFGHFTISVYIGLLEKPWAKEIGSIFGLKKDMKDCIDLLNKYKYSRKANYGEIDDIKKLLLDSDKNLPKFIYIYKKCKRKLNKMLKQAGISTFPKLRKNIPDVGSYYVAWLGFSVLLLPLTIATQFYSSKFIYPDFSRGLDIDYRKTNLAKHLKDICSLLKENTHSVMKSIKILYSLTYTLLCETLEFRLRDIGGFLSNREKIERIEESMEQIKNDNFVRYLMEKLRNDKLTDVLLSYVAN